MNMAIFTPLLPSKQGLLTGVIGASNLLVVGMNFPNSILVAPSGASGEAH
jgi:hypothetical protein